MKLLHVITSLYTGGAETLVVNMVPRFQALGHEVGVVVFNGGHTPLMERLEKECPNCKLYKLGDSFYNPWYIIKLVKIMRDYDIVHTHNSSPQLYAAIANLFCRKKLVTTEHNTNNRKRGNCLLSKIDRWMYSRYDRVICISNQAETNLRKYLKKGELKTQIETIYNGVDIDVFHPYNYQFSRSRHYQVLGVASVWEKRKGLDAFRQLRKMLPENYDIKLVGLTDRQVRRLPDGISAISRTDSIQELVELYANADVFVNPSQAESFGMTTAEALACGTPAIVYNTTACPELVDAHTGGVVPLDDVQALTDAVRTWCEKSRKGDTRRQCRERAVRLFSRQDRYQEYFDLYDSLLNK